MGKQSRLLAVFGCVLIGLYLACGQTAPANSVLFNNCNDMENCMRYFESDTCNNAGERQVCLDWVNFDACDAISPPLDQDETVGNNRVRICTNTNFDIAAVPVNEQKCFRVRGGSTFNFGVQADTATDGTANTGDGSMIRINGFSSPVLCQALRSVCAPTGNRDFNLTFTSMACPAAPTTTTIAPTTTMTAALTTTKKSCVCSSWGQWSGCTATCGSSGKQSRTRSCNAHCSNPALSDHRACLPTPNGCPKDGRWSGWSSFVPSICPVTCGGSTQMRSRECSNPPPVHGGRGCPGSSIQSIPCNNVPCPSAPVPRPRPRPTPSGGFRACKRRARKRCRSQRPRRRCIHDICGHLRG